MTHEERPTWQTQLDIWVQYHREDVGPRIDSLIGRSFDELERFLTRTPMQLLADYGLGVDDDDVQLIEDEVQLIEDHPKDPRDLVAALFIRTFKKKGHAVKTAFNAIHKKCVSKLGSVLPIMSKDGTTDLEDQAGPLLAAQRTHYRQQFRLLLDRFLVEARQCMAHCLETRDRGGTVPLGPRQKSFPCPYGYIWLPVETQMFAASEEAQDAKWDSQERFSATFDAMLVDMRALMSEKGYKFVGFSSNDPIDID